MGAEAVGDDPVDLLGHREVEAAQARLDVGDRQAHLHRGQHRRQGRVDVAGDDQQVGLLVLDHRLQPLHRARRLLGVGAGADLEHVIGRGHAELLEEDLRHRPVVVLAGVDDHVVAVRQAAPHRGDHRGGLDEVGSGTDHVEDSHRAVTIPREMRENLLATRALAAGTGRGRPRASGSASMSDPYAEDENSLGRQEALQEVSHGQDPWPSRVLQPHSREKVAEEKAEPCEARSDREG